MFGRGIGRVGRRPLLRTVGRTAAVVGTATVVSGAVRGHQDNKAQTQQEAAAYEQQQAAAAQQAQQPVYAPPPAPAAPVDNPTDDLLDQLTKLGQLKADGVLTDAEFDAQKARLLA